MSNVSYKDVQIVNSSTDQLFALKDWSD